MPRQLPVATTPTVQERAATLEAELSALRQIEAVITTIQNLKRKHPKLFSEFIQAIHAAVDSEPPAQEAKPTILHRVDPDAQEFGVQRLIEWFHSRNNEPATVPQMAKAVDLSTATVKSIIYRRHKGKFAPIDQRGQNNRAFFRLVEG